MFDISPLAEKYAPWSYSKAETANTCPSQFAHRYIHRTDGAVTPSANKVGTVAHSILEHRVAGVPAESAMAKALETTPLTSTEAEDLEVLQSAIESFLVRFDAFCKRESVINVVQEVAWGFTRDFQATNFFSPDVYFRGKVDLGAVTKNNDLIVIDHKSGVARDISNDKKKKYQLFSYAVLALPNLPLICGVRGGINFMRGEENIRSQWVDYIDANTIRKRFTPWLFRFINEAAENLIEPFVAKPKLRWPCEWCSYRHVCPALAELTDG